jgi:hypothetical protein
VFADIVHESGFTQTLVSTLSVSAAGGMAPPNAPTMDPDDSWAVGRADPNADSARAVLPDGTVLEWRRSPAPLVAGEEAGLRFAAIRPAGDTASLEPFLGMAGHAVVVKDDAKVFIHLHPLGTISLAAQAKLTPSPDAMSHAMNGGITAQDSLYFPYAFPQPGAYTVWVQIKRHGRVLTGSFPVNVTANTPSTAR